MGPLALLAIIMLGGGGLVGLAALVFTVAYLALNQRPPHKGRYRH